MLSECSANDELVDPCKYLRGTSDVLSRIPILAVDHAVERLYDAYVASRTVYLFGNGGSAALASHIACDLGKGTRIPDEKPFRVLSLTDNVPLITAWANDTSYDDVFAEQLRSFMAPGDISFAISGSGNSPNVLKGLRTSRELGGCNIGLTGHAGGKMRSLCDVCVIVPSQNMQQIEDAHVCVMHAIFLALRRQFKMLSANYAKGAVG